MRTIAAALLIAALATPASAQTALPNPGFGGNNMQHPKSLDEIKREQDRENGYKAGLSKIPDQKATTDPWGDVRTDPKTSQAKVPTNQKKAKAD
jgi:hypothetical protein